MPCLGTFISFLQLQTLIMANRNIAQKNGFDYDIPVFMVNPILWITHTRGSIHFYNLSEAWSGVNWADLMAAQGAFGTDFYDRSTRTLVGTVLWTEYRPVIKIGPKSALGSHEIRPIHSALSLGQSITIASWSVC